MAMNGIQGTAFWDPGRSEDWQPKAWGSTRTVVDSPLYCRTLLRALAGGYSSIHYHRARANRFTVVRGTLEIWVLYGWLLERVRLTDGNRYDVPSLVVHAFYAVEDCEAIEEYWPDRGGEIHAEDIVRLNHGGVCPDAAPDAIAELPGRIMRGGFGNG